MLRLLLPVLSQVETGRPDGSHPSKHIQETDLEFPFELPGGPQESEDVNVHDYEKENMLMNKRTRETRQILPKEKVQHFDKCIATVIKSS